MQLPNIRWKSMQNLIKDSIYEFFIRNFDKEGYQKSSFRAWKPLSDSTLSSRASRGLGTKILNATGDLRASVELNSRGPNLTISSDKEYASFVNEERPFIYESSTLDKEISNLIQKEIEQTLNYRKTIRI